MFPFSVALPPPVLPGARVGVAALSGPVDPELLDAGLQALENLGFEPVRSRNLARRHRLFAGDDAERVEAFHELVADPTVEAVIFARGGHGVLRVLGDLDWQLLARTPRAYVGYSDVTPFLNEVPKRLGFASLHGPMVAVDLARGLLPEETNSLLRALAGQWPARVPLAPAGAPVATSGQPMEGRLLGGCLSLLAASLGTEFAVLAERSLLLIEEIDEPAYRVDRMLTQLRLSGSLKGLRGLLVGSLEATACSAEIDELAELEEVVRQAAFQLDVPWAATVPTGHTVPNYTLPLGLTARFLPETVELEIGLVDSVDVPAADTRS